MKMSDVRVWIGGSVGIALFVALLGWFMFIGPTLSDSSALRQQTATAQQVNGRLRSDIATLQKQRTGLPTLVNKLTHERLQLPVTDALPLFARSTNAHARASHIALASMTVGLVAPVDASGALTTSAAQVTNPAGHLFAIPVTIVSTGRYDNQVRFLAGLQKLGPRVALVTGVRFAPTEQATLPDLDQLSSLTTSMSVFVAPLTPQQNEQLAKQLAGSH
jgi:Tfp pilus assembly protein PilO